MQKCTTIVLNLALICLLMLSACNKEDNEGVGEGTIEATINGAAFRLKNGFIDVSNETFYMVAENDEEQIFIRIQGYTGKKGYGLGDESTFFIYKLKNADGTEVWHTADHELGSASLSINSDSGSGADRVIGGSFSFTTGKSTRYDQAFNSTSLSSANISLSGDFKFKQRPRS